MKMINKLSFLFMATALLFTGCKDPEGGPVTPSDGELVLSVNKPSIKDNGTDAATFTVKYGNADVTSAAIIKNGDTEIEGATFTSTEKGEYIFTATYTDPQTEELKTSNQVKVNVTAESSGNPTVSLVVAPETLPVNSTEKAVFTVTFEEQDVTAEAVITNVTTDEVMEKGINEFSSPGYKGDFRFKATYNGITSNEVTVVISAPVESGLRLKVDKARLATGEKATFTVWDKETDVTANAKIRNVTDNEEVTGNEFTLTKDGTVNFVAEYDGKTSQILSVGTGSFHKNVMALKFTSIGCGYCPMMAASLEKAKTLLPDKIVEVAVHHPLMGSDPMIPANIAEFNYFPHPQKALPITYYDMTAYSPQAESASDVLGRIRPLSKLEPAVGITATSKLEGGAVTVDVEVTATRNREFFLAVMLLENGIVHKQNSGGENYVHNYTLRETLSGSIFGDSLGEMTEGQVVSKQFTGDASKYNADNCRIVAYVCYKEGEVWNVANIVELPVEGWIDYKFR